MQDVPPKPSLEKIVENFITAQAQQNKEFLNQNIHVNEMITQLGTKVDQIVTHNKMLETQISQVALKQAPETTPGGQFPGQAQQNPRSIANAVTLRSGTVYDGPINPTVSEPKTSKKSIVPTEEVEEPVESKKQKDKDE